jgi:hypothetical protein
MRRRAGLLWLGDANVFLEAHNALLEWSKTLIDILADVIHESGKIVR